jgi:antagonist of KipI
MSLVFLTNSLLATVQDLGRNKYRRFGINPNGAMDKTAARLINILLGNNENEAVLEMHFPAPQVRFEKDALIALGGANFGARIDEKEIENWRPIFVPKNSVLSFSRKIFGNRIYLAVKGGFEIEKWLESASTNLKAHVGGYQGRPLQKNDRLFFKRQTANSYSKTVFSYKISKSLIPPYSPFPTVRVIAGEEFEKLTEESQNAFKIQSFTVSNQSDRMGFRLKSESLKLKEPLQLVSSAVSFGTIQLLPNGQLIILMADHQTTGGYPRIAHIISQDLPLVAQLGANDKLNFAFISIEEAENLILQTELELNYLKVGISQKFLGQLC